MCSTDMLYENKYYAYMCESTFNIIHKQTIHFLRIDWNCFSSAAARCALDWKQISSSSTFSTAALRSTTGVNAVDFLTAEVEVIPANDDPLDLIFSLACIISAVLNPNADGFALLFGAAIPAKSSDDCCGFESENRCSSAFLAGCPNCDCLSVPFRSVGPTGPVGCPRPTVCAGPLPSSSEKDTASITRLFRFSLFFSLLFSPCSGMQTPIVKECPATI